jgi:hypothetical protein
MTTLCFRIRILVIGVLICIAVPAFTRLCAQSPAASAVDGLHDIHVSLPKLQYSLKDAFAAIEQQTHFTFVYMKDAVPSEEPVRLHTQEYALDTLLGELSRAHGIVFSRVNSRLIVKKAPPVRTETVEVIGTVYDKATNESLVYASVSIDGTQQGMMTDASGRFSLSVMPGRVTIRCGFVGYAPEVIAVDVETTAELNIAMTATDVVLQDVTVFAHRADGGNDQEVNALTLQSETIKRVTSLIPDVMRSVQMLPGVSTNNEFSSKFNVRGGNQDENLVVVNGTQVYDPFHVKEVSNASIGIFNADMIKKMDLITGGFPARYGDKMSSVLNIEYREGSRDHYSGMASMSLMDVNALVEGPMGEHGSFMIGARKSYFEYVMKLLDAGPFLHPSFYDVQGVFAYAPSPAGKLLLKLIHSGDNFFEDPHSTATTPLQWYGYDNTGARFMNRQQRTDSATISAAYYSNMVALQYTQILSSDAIIRSELSFYDQRENENAWRDYVYGYVGENSQTRYFYNSTTVNQYENALRIRTLEINSMLDLQLAPSYCIKAGASAQRISYMQSLLNRQTIDEFTNEYAFPDTTLSHRIVNASDEVQDGIDAQSYKAAGFLENVVQLTDRLIVNAGGRVDYFGLNRDLTWSPRVNLAYDAGGSVVLRAAWGHYYQSPVFRQIASPIASDTNTRSQHAVHIVAGINYEYVVDKAAHTFLRVKAEGYHKSYDNLVTAWMTSQGQVQYSRRNDADGKTYGLDVQLTYSTPVFYGWISYGYLVARQTSVVNGIPSTFPRYTDQRHTLAITGEFDLGREWSVSSRFAFGSGYPYTPSHAVINPVKRIWEWIPDSVPNGDYLPAYSRVDLKVSKDLRLFDWGTSVFIDVSNILNSTNIQSYRYSFNSQGQPYREDVKLWPILPTFGLSVRF